MCANYEVIHAVMAMSQEKKKGLVEEPFWLKISTPFSLAIVCKRHLGASDPAKGFVTIGAPARPVAVVLLQSRPVVWS